MPSGFTMMNDAIIRSDVWVPITIRVAWDLHLAKIAVRPNILSAARIHVLSHLEADVTVEQAEVLAGIYTQDFMRRYQENAYVRPDLTVDLDHPLPPDTRDLLLKNVERICHRVFWFHYSDGFSLERTARKVGKPVRAVESMCKMFRKRMRKIGHSKGLGIHEWSDERVDQALGYVGSLATGEPLDFDVLGTDAGKKHTRKCPRLRRAHYLLRGGVLSPRDLEVPSDNHFVDRKEMLALLLHPDARQHASVIEAALGDLAIPIDAQGNAWLVDVDSLDEVEGVLIQLAGQATPERDCLRGAMVSGPGVWLDSVLVGPLPLRCLDAARSRPWGSIDGIDELPLPLPPPPKMTQWWVSAGASTLLFLSSLAWAFDDAGPKAQFPFSSEFDSHVDFVDVRFDVSDRAYVTIVQWKGGILQSESSWTPSTKGQLATGDGRYIHRVDASQIIVISSPQEIEDLDALLQAAQVDSDPVNALERHLLSHHPLADIIISPSVQVQ